MLHNSTKDQIRVLNFHNRNIWTTHPQFWFERNCVPKKSRPANDDEQSLLQPKKGRCTEGGGGGEDIRTEVNNIRHREGGGRRGETRTGVIQPSQFFAKKKKEVIKEKSKAVPQYIMQAKGERNYSSYSFFTSALDGDEWLASFRGRDLRPGKTPGNYWIGGCVWSPEPVWTQRLEASAEIELWSQAVLSAVRHYTVWRTPTPEGIRSYYESETYLFIEK
jgi:hypothetical protein